MKAKVLIGFGHTQEVGRGRNREVVEVIDVRPGEWVDVRTVIPAQGLPHRLCHVQDSQGGQHIVPEFRLDMAGM